MEVKNNLGKQLKNLPRACRKAAVLLSQEEKNVELVMSFLEPFAEYEASLYHKWYLKMVRDINDLRVDPETYAYQLVVMVRDNEKVNIEKVKALAEKHMAKQQVSGHRPSRVLGQVIDALRAYLLKRDKFYSYAVSYMLKLDMDGLKESVLSQEESYRRRNEDQLFQIQVLKHVRNLQDYEKPIPMELLKIALLTEFSGNRKVLDLQCLVVYHIYDSHSDKPLVIKQMCFDFIREVLTNITGHATLIHWLFLDDWISKETHDLLVDAHPMLNKLSMCSVVYFKALKLYEKWQLNRRAVEQLTTPEKFVVNIMALYSDGCSSVHENVREVAASLQKTEL